MSGSLSPAPVAVPLAVTYRAPVLRNTLLLLVALAVTVWILIPPTSLHAETRATCRRTCRDGIAACAAAHTTLAPRAAKRICKKELLPRCVRDGVIECLRAPHYRGGYTFDGALLDTTCTTLPPGYPAEPVSMGFLVRDRFRDSLDVTIYASDTIEAYGTGTTIPWTIGDGACIFHDGTSDWCGYGTLTVGGPPPRHPKSPRPSATLLVEVTVYRPVPSSCTRRYAGEVQHQPEPLGPRAVTRSAP